jgi:hypothetical protein
MIIYYKQRVALLVAVFLFVNNLCGQQVKIAGIIMNDSSVAIENATVYTKALEHEEGLLFSVTDAQGSYKLKLSKEKSYLLTISHLGYDEIIDTLFLKEDTIKNYVLKESTESLDEIVLRRKLAIEVKKDTITYQADRFTNGNERKLRDVLDKLPGVEVDREGNVKVNGKDVTKLMVDGKDFFNGDEKLGVNNIPADAIEEIVALDNYTAIPWLKGLADSDQLALNIKLKEGKRNFVFGDIKAGGGIKERYKVNPVLFYYSPQTAVNVIGDFNNTGVRSFTTSDYLNFEIDGSTLLNNISNITETLNDPVAQSLSNTNFKNLETLFAAFNVNHDFKSGLNLTAYTINNRDRQDVQEESEINYLINNPFTESRSSLSNQNSNFTANTIKLNYATNNDLDILGRVDFKNFNGDLNRRLQSFSVNNNQFNNLDQSTGDYTLSQKLNINKRFNAKHISTIESSLVNEKRDGNGENTFTESIFSGLVPFINQPSNIFDLRQLSTSRTAAFNIALKHYYVINASTHLYPLGGFSTTNIKFENTDFQLLDSGEVNSFENQGFNNNLDSNLNDAYLGVELKKKFGNYIVKPGIVTHLYDWNATQFDQRIVNNSKLVVLPELSIDYEPSNYRKIRFKYQMQSSFANPREFANRLRINTFNQITQGNENLENSLYHNLNLSYNSFKLLEGTIFNASISYSHFLEGVRNSTAIQGINQIQTLINTSLPENNYRARLKYSKSIWGLKWSYGGNVYFSDYKRIINESQLAYKSLFTTNKVDVATRFKKGPNFEIEIGHQFNSINGGGIANNFETWNSAGSFELQFLKNVLFLTSYDLTYFQNNSTGQSDNFNTVDASLEYWKKSSAWDFKLEVTNLFNNEVRLSNNITQFQSSENRLFVQPRILLLSVAYKL